MRNHHTSSFRSSVGTGFIVVFAALLAWTFDLYTPYLQSSTPQPSAAAQTLASTAGFQ